MFYLPRRKRYILFIILIVFVALTTAVVDAQQETDKSSSTAGNSSIEVCFDSNGNPGPITFSGNLGEFTLTYPYTACHKVDGLEAGAYSITETLPEGWYPWMEPICRYKYGSYFSDYESTWLSVTIELAADTDVYCRFSSYEDPNEPNDIMAQATLSAYGGHVNGYLSPHPDVARKGDRDFYGFYGYAGDELFITGEVFPYADSPYVPWLILLDADNKTIADGYGSGNPTRSLRHLLPSTGMYYLVVGSPCTIGIPNCMGRAGFGISILDRFEPNDSPDTATPIQFGDTLRASIIDDYHEEPPDTDVDYFYFQGSQADEVKIEINRFGDAWSHVCQLLDEKGVMLASDYSPYCRLESVLPADGTYYIKVALGCICYRTLPCAYEVKLQKTNKAPQAAPESYKVFSGETLTIGAPGVLDNDSDPDGDPLTAVLTSNVLNGDLDLASDGSFSYKPNAGYTGNDRFYYAASDGNLKSESVRVDIKVEYKNKAPVANPDSYKVLAGETLTTSAPGVLGNDNDPEDDPLTAVFVSNVQHGALSLNKNGAFTYTPHAGYAGEDSFQYCASDGSDESNHARVSITVANENNAPITNPDIYQILTGKMLVIPAPGVLKNDVDLDGDPLTAVLTRDVLNGDLKLSSDGSFSYEPKPGFIGSDTFQYYAFDGRDPALVSTVTITVRPFTLYLPGIQAK